MPELKYIDEFHDALKNYHLSSHAEGILHTIKLVVMTAPTASGRNTIINELLRTNAYNFIVSDTTREPRENNGILEQNGREYFFRDETEMLADIKAGDFLEAEVIHEQQVSGISIRELEKASQEHRAAITDMDIGGVLNLLDLKPDTIAVLVLPPSFEVWHERIFSRGDMDDLEYGRRLKTAARILASGIKESTELKIIINDDLTDAAEEVHELVQQGIFSEEQQFRGVALAEQLLIETQAALSTLD
jgi:guanylate kinase